MVSIMWVASLQRHHLTYQWRLLSFTRVTIVRINCRNLATDWLTKHVFRSNWSYWLSLGMSVGQLGEVRPEFVLTPNRLWVKPYREKREVEGGGRSQGRGGGKRILVLRDLTLWPGWQDQLPWNDQRTEDRNEVVPSGDSEETVQVLEKEIPGLARRWETLLGKENLLLPKSLFLWYR